MKIAVLVFPGSNCDHDAYHAFKHVLGVETEFVWHKETSLAGYDGAVVPGGFSYGDYLRCGAIAKFSPIMRELPAFVAGGRPVLGICNGFQILVEAGLLEGALMRNRDLHFLCQDVFLRVEAAVPFTARARLKDVLRMPIAHGEGNYFADAETLARIEGEGRVAFRYADEEGKLTEAANPNGSIHGIAGVVNKARNVLGMMPHPERAAEKLLGGEDGRVILESMLGAAGA
ncbi:MAG: phosphoribosylformylglycinamidine synthase subunit PurQ [Candidatus Methylomirabilis sp.]|nr:phosphoribosylformylglycinamidine synthase subunit PurQ [Deltaproteobacteria bacterium]